MQGVKLAQMVQAVWVTPEVTWVIMRLLSAGGYPEGLMIILAKV